MKTFQIVSGDVVLDELGRPVLVTGETKLLQDVMESLVVGRNKDGYGAGLADLIGTIPLGNVPAGIVLKVRQALEYYRSLQRTQPDLSPSERLIKLINVTSERIRPGHTDYSFNVYIQNGKDPTPIQVCLLHRPTLRG